ncbi:MAG: 3-phosphoshikimate 1-carboxyvinyltransferase, partial [Oscillospiraceae bacterium]|nr:3-phosphoshikimate 1-carboxyvinyltransferase [Oscillospiraceae bacterium]
MQDLKNKKFYPGFKTGTVSVPCSKSIAHRAQICAALAGGQSTIRGIDPSEDINATIGAIEAIKNGDGHINCKESGSTLRFLIPVAAALGLEATFAAEGSLQSRTVGLYEQIFIDKGVKFESNGGKPPASITGRLLPGKFFVPGNISSQYITGLMLALPLLGEDSEIALTSPLESEPYANLTIDVLKSFGVKIEKTAGGYFVPGNQKYQNADFAVEGDYSQAAFFMCAGAINGDIKIKRLNPDSLQGDAR